MSQENVEIVERAMNAFNRRDVEGFVESATSDFEWLPAMGATVERDSFLGREGAEKYFEELHDTWEEVRLAAQELRDLGDAPSILGGSRAVDERAASRWTRRSGRYSTFAATSSPVSVPT